MAAVVWRRRAPVALPLVWPLLGHLYAMFPDFLFTAGIAHRHWMDVFLGHIRSHYVVGGNITWYLVFVASLGTYLLVLATRASPWSTELRAARPRRNPTTIA